MRRILDENPEARPRVRGAVVSLLATAVVSIGVIGVFLIWHLRRRARLIRERLAPPRKVTLPELLPPGDGDGIGA